MTNENLQETKGSFKLIGKVTRIDKDGAFKEETMDKPNNKNHGRLYRSIRFGTKTSPTNEITVGSFDYEPKEVFLWHSDKAKEEREKGGKYKGLRVPFGQWEQQKEILKEQGHSVLQSRVGLTYGEDGKLQTEGLPRFVASAEIYEELNNGDSVVVEGTLRYSRYKNNQDKWVEQTNYTIEKLFKIKDVDFEAEDFEEVTYFEQEMVFVGADIDKKEGKAYITGRVIDFMKNYNDTQFIVDFTDGEGGYDAPMVKLAEAFAKKMKFGDVINVFGDTLNRVIVSEVEDEEEDEDDIFAQLGGKHKPKHAQSYTARTYVTEMQIHGVDSWDKGVYTEEDFEKDELIEEDNKLNEELGGKKKPNNKSPFDSDEDAGIIGEDDLPF